MNNLGKGEAPGDLTTPPTETENLFAPNGGFELDSADLQTELDRRVLADGSWLEGVCRYAVFPCGKLLRSRLLLCAGTAVGGAARDLLPAAVGTEFGHVASLIHDDLIDGDDLRRGRPSVAAKFGLEGALLSGDALIFSLFRSLAECRSARVSDERIVAALHLVATAGLDLCLGQGLESTLRGNWSCPLETYLTMIRLKTASFFRGACQCGAALGGGSTAQIEILGRYGDHLGIAFQIGDDLLPYLSDSEITGKPAISDIRNGRLTLPLILAMREEGMQHSLMALISGSRSVDEGMNAVRELVCSAGTSVIAQSIEILNQHSRQAVNELEALAPSESRDRLTTIARAVVGRIR